MSMPVTSDLWPNVNLPRFAAGVTLLTVLECLLWYPSELVKTRLQVSSTEQRLTLAANYDMGKRIFQSAGGGAPGVLELYRGALFSVCTTVPQNLLYNSCYNASLAHLETSPPSFLPPSLAPALAGAAAEVACLSVAVPADVVLVRAQAGEEAGRSVSMIAAAVLRKDGVAGLYRGTVASLLLQLPNSMVWWSVFEASKLYFVRARDRSGSGGQEERSYRASSSHEDPLSFANFAAGSLAGVAAAIVTNPLDVAKTRIQSGLLGPGGGGERSVARVLMEAIKKEGIRSLGKGLAGRMVVAVPSSIVHGIFYEGLMKFSQTTTTHHK